MTFSNWIDIVQSVAIIFVALGVIRCAQAIRRMNS